MTYTPTHPCCAPMAGAWTSAAKNDASAPSSRVGIEPVRSPKATVSGRVGRA